MSSKCGNILRRFSLGKYNTKLYFGAKENQYSTITGGIITILVAIVVVATSLNILYQTIYWENYTITTNYVELKEFS